MKEEYQVSTRKCDECHRKDAIANHQVGDQFWLCERCFRNRERDKSAPFVDWTTRESIDNLTESMHYFAELYRDRPYRRFELVKKINGSKGPICNVLDMVRDVKDPLGMEWPRYHRYYQLFNRRYLERGSQVFERGSSMKGPWQTVHQNVLEEAVFHSNTLELRDSVAIVIIMQSKTVWYIDPMQLHTFSYQYETYNPQEGGCSIPISKLSQEDPFF